MKEGKKKTTAKRNMSSTRKAAPKTEPPKVKKVDVNDINKDFEDVENEDRRLIVFIAIAILVIVGTVIGLLVGCEKKENPEPEKPNTDVVVPEKPDEKGNKDDGVKTREIVRKVRSTYRAKKKNSSGSGKKTVTTYNVTFYLGEDSQTEEVENGKPSTAYVPTGYSECKYYKDADLTEEYDITGNVKENVNVYMACTAIEYSVVYESGDETVEITTTNPTTYMVTDGEVALSDPTLNVVTTEEQLTDETVVDVFFAGWYTASGEKTTTLNKNVVTSASADNVITLTAKITDEEPVVEEVVDEELTDEPLDAEPMQMAKERTEEVLEELPEETEVPEVEEVLEPVEVETPVVEEVEPVVEEVVTEPTEVPEVVEEEPETVEPTEEVPEVVETPAVEEVPVVVPEEVTEEPEAVEPAEPTEPEVVEEVKEPTPEPVVTEPEVVEEEKVEVKETTPEPTPVVVEEVKEVKEEKVTEVKEEVKETKAPEVPEVPVEVVTPVKKEEPAKKVEEKKVEVEKVEEEEVPETTEGEE